MRPIIRQIELARMAGVSATTVNKRVKQGELRAALCPDGRKLYADDPNVLGFLYDRIGRAHSGSDGAPTPPALQLYDPQSSVPRADPFAYAAELANMGGAEIGANGSPAPDSPSQGGGSGGPSSEARADFALWELQQTAPRELPPDVDDLGALTLREVMQRYGSLGGMREAVKALKDFADMQSKQQLAATRRRDLVERTAVSRVFTPLVDLAFKRLIGEMPVALRQQIVARVLAGGDDLAMDVEELIRREAGTILEDCKSAVLTELDKLEAGR